MGVWTRRSHAAMAATGLKRPLTSPARLPISANRSIRNSTLIQKPPVEIQSESRTGPAAHPRSCSATIQQQLTRKKYEEKNQSIQIAIRNEEYFPSQHKTKMAERIPDQSDGVKMSNHVIRGEGHRLKNGTWKREQKHTKKICLYTFSK